MSFGKWLPQCLGLKALINVWQISSISAPAKAAGRHVLLSQEELIVILRFWVNSLGPSDAIWRQRPGSTLAQVIACCLTAPSHYLNQCWLIISKVDGHSSKGKFTKTTQPSITEIIWKIKLLKLHSNFPEANELMEEIYMLYLSKCSPITNAVGVLESDWRYTLENWLQTKMEVKAEVFTVIEIRDTYIHPAFKFMIKSYNNMIIKIMINQRNFKFKNMYVNVYIHIYIDMYFNYICTYIVHAYLHNIPVHCLLSCV